MASSLRLIDQVQTEPTTDQRTFEIRTNSGQPASIDNAELKQILGAMNDGNSPFGAALSGIGKPWAEQSVTWYGLSWHLVSYGLKLL